MSDGLDVNLDLTEEDFYELRIGFVESKTAKVGIRDKSLKAAIPDENKTRILPNDSSKTRVRAIKDYDPENYSK